MRRLTGILFAAVMLGPFGTAFAVTPSERDIREHSVLGRVAERPADGPSRVEARDNPRHSDTGNRGGNPDQDPFDLQIYKYPTSIWW